MKNSLDYKKAMEIAAKELNISKEEFVKNLCNRIIEDETAPQELKDKITNNYYELL